MKLLDPSPKKPRRHMSLMLEVSVLYSLILAFTLLVFSGVIFFIISQTLYTELDHEVELKATEIAANIQGWMNDVLLSIPVILLLMNFSGWILVRSILKPVRKISEAANAISYADLSKRVAKESSYAEMESLVDAFNNMIDRLEKSFSHIQNFSSHMAHELKTPLTIMRGETELALMAERSPQEYRQAFKIILDEIAKMLKIIEDLLFLTRMDHQPGTFTFGRVNLQDFFREVYEQAKLLAAKKEIYVQLDAYPRRPVFVKADAVHLRRLFLNLLDNAIEYSPPKSRIRTTIDFRNNKVTVTVEDEGPGISQAEIEKIFERFYSVAHHRSGSGLGLSIAQAIAKAHGGRIQVQSRSPHGAIFTVTLPAAN